LVVRDYPCLYAHGYDDEKGFCVEIRGTVVRGKVIRQYRTFGMQFANNFIHHHFQRLQQMKYI
jgi:hypothetical protein